MQSVSTLWDFLSRSGPEDDLCAVPLGKNSGSPTSGQDYGIARTNPTPSSDLYYKDVEEAQRLVSIVESDGPEGKIITSLRESRNLCAQTSFAMELCKRSVRAHQLKSCTPTYVEHLKCNVKLARAVDYTCRPQFVNLATCLKGAEGDSAKCLPQATQFDICTESW